MAPKMCALCDKIAWGEELNPRSQIKHHQSVLILKWILENIVHSIRFFVSVQGWCYCRHSSLLFMAGDHGFRLNPWNVGMQKKMCGRKQSVRKQKKTQWWWTFITTKNFHFANTPSGTQKSFLQNGNRL